MNAFINRNTNPQGFQAFLTNSARWQILANPQKSADLWKKGTRDPEQVFSHRGEGKEKKLNSNFGHGQSISI